MSYWWFWSRYRSDNILTKFWTIWPLPSRGHAWVKRGQIFKMLQMTFHIYQITLEVIRIKKNIYSLLCVGFMVMEILTKGHPKVKWGQIFNNIRFSWMIYQIIPLSLNVPKIYTLKLSELSLERSPFVWIQTMIVVKEVLKCRMAIIDYKKSIIHITL